LSGPLDQDGLTNTHWFISSVAFTCIIHIIVLKLFLESVFWNYLSTLTGIACLLMYYGCVIGLNTVFVSQIIQPELTGEYYLIF